MTQIDIAALVAKLSSQIGDDIQVIFNHESLFKQSRAAIIAQDAELKRYREALETVAGVGHDMPATWSGDDLAWARRRAAIMQQTARAALGEKT